MNFERLSESLSILIEEHDGYGLVLEKSLIIIRWEWLQFIIRW